jgi:RimJ/RimL family protein N-acetyltransferase
MTQEEFNFSVEQEEDYIKNITLFLVAEVDGKIIGSLLKKKVIEWADLNKVEKIDLEVFEDNEPAISLYKKFGFLEEGRKRKAIKTNETYKDIFLMGRFLNG